MSLLTGLHIPSPVLTTLRIVMGMIFIASGFEKIIDLKFFELIIAEYQIVPPALIPAAALSLSLIELLCGIMLVMNLFSRSNAFVLSIITALFIAGMVNNLTRDIEHECGCFEFLGQWFGLKEEIGIGAIIRDLVFFMLLLLVGLAGSDRIPWKKPVEPA
ncbi:MAG: DoxX family protein [Chlorobium sp.]|nr:MAG: DoxX family protein [Chlorobium sp.]